MVKDAAMPVQRRWTMPVQSQRWTKRGKNRLKFFHQHRQNNLKQIKRKMSDSEDFVLGSLLRGGGAMEPEATATSDVEDVTHAASVAPGPVATATPGASASEFPPMMTADEAERTLNLRRLREWLIGAQAVNA